MGNRLCDVCYKDNGKRIKTWIESIDKFAFVCWDCAPSPQDEEEEWPERLLTRLTTDNRPLWQQDPPDVSEFNEAFNIPTVEYTFTVIPPCIYFLIDGSEVVYVGQTVNLSSRTSTHYLGDACYTDPKIFDRVIYLPMHNSTEDWRIEIERQLVYYFKPKYNGEKSKKGTSCYTAVPWIEDQL